MTDEPLSLGALPHKVGRNFRWTIVMFLVAAVATLGLIIWQLYQTSPKVWCQLAADANDARYSSCSGILLRLIDVKDHTIIGLLGIFGIIILAVAVVALGVAIKGSGPGGFNVDISSDKTRVSDADGNAATVPTPPAEG